MPSGATLISSTGLRGIKNTIVFFIKLGKWWTPMPHALIYYTLAPYGENEGYFFIRKLWALKA